MGYSFDFKQRVIATRKRGLSYNEIRRRFKISKSTISLWCGKILLDPRKLELLAKKTKSNWVFAVENRKKKELLRREEIKSVAAKEIQALKPKDIFLTGLALYWGEGTKYDGDVAFSNSDPGTVRLIMRFFRESCCVKEEKLRGRLFIHPQEKHFQNRSEREAVKFWSEITSIPLSRFHKTNFYKTKPTNFRRGKIMPFGTLMVRVIDADLHRKIMGWIRGLVEKI